MHERILPNSLEDFLYSHCFLSAKTMNQRKPSYKKEQTDKIQKKQSDQEKTESMVNPYFTYKDRVFRMLFKDRNRLLELYNALNDTDYKSYEDLEVNILDNALYIKIRNDVSFVIDGDICLYEHQSTYCPNMPLRGLLYLSDLYRKILVNVDLSSSRRITIPTPHYVVLYNGKERKKEKFIQKLSDSYEGSMKGEDKDKGCMELIVQTLNINLGQNEDLLRKSPSLYGYSYFVAAVRRNMESMELLEATESAVKECIEKDILKDFFLEQRSEVVAMSIYEYNEEYIRRTLLEDGYADGRRKGLTEAVDVMMEKFHIGLREACESVGLSEKDYMDEKQNIPLEHIERL